MMHAVEITITRLPGDNMGAGAQVPATARLVAIAGSGRHCGDHGIHVFSAPSPPQPAWERRGFIAGDGGDDLWRLIEKAAAWAAIEAEKRA